MPVIVELDTWTICWKRGKRWSNMWWHNCFTSSSSATVHKTCAENLWRKRSESTAHFNDSLSTFNCSWSKGRRQSRVLLSIGEHRRRTCLLLNEWAHSSASVSLRSLLYSFLFSEDAKYAEIGHTATSATTHSHTPCSALQVYSATWNTHSLAGTNVYVRRRRPQWPVQLL